MGELEQPDEKKSLYDCFRELSRPDFELRQWFADVVENHRLNLARNSAFYSEAKQIDDIFQRFLKVAGIVHLGDIYNSSLALFARSHSAFLTSVMLSLNGQLAEAHMVMRGCLESCLYAVMIHFDPALHSVWMNREKSLTTKAASRRAFTARAAFDVLGSNRPIILPYVRQLYDATIANGAHPNFGAVGMSLGAIQGEYGPRLAHYYLGGPQTPLFPVCLARVVSVGWAALDISTCMYEDLFCELGLFVEIQNSRWQDRVRVRSVEGRK